MDKPVAYVENNRHQRAFIHKTLKEHKHLIEWNKTEPTVLDVGCGPGDVTTELLLPFLPQDVKKIVGVDVSSQMVDYANEKYGSKKTDFQVLDITAKHVPKQLIGFDFIFSFLCLNWVQDQSAAFANMYKMLNPGGQIFVLFMSSSALSDIILKLKNDQKWRQYVKSDAQNVSPYNHLDDAADAIREVVETVGFESLLIITIDSKTFLDDLPQYLKAATAIDGIYQYLPEHLKEEYLRELETISKEVDVITCNKGQIEKIIMTAKLALVIATKAK